MSTGHGSGLPDYSGGYGGDAGDPYGADRSYGGAHDPYGQTPSAPEDPYAVGYEGTDPYARDPLDADGFGPVFGTEAEAPASGYAAAASAPGQPYPTQYPGPYGYGPYAPPPPSSGAAITSLVLGLLALTMCAGLTAPVGVIFAAKGMKETGPQAHTAKSGRGLAIAGLVTSLIGLIPLLFFLLYIGMMILVIVAETSAA